jgi:hypothetical protein
MRTETRSWRWRWTAGAGLALGLTAAAARPAPAQVLPLALELDGTRVTLGSQAELVLRTTEARALASAAFAFEVRDRDGVPAVAFAALESYELLSGGAAATIVASFDATAQRATVEITSPDATLNEELGPLAVFRFSLDASLVVGDRREIWVDPDAALVDALAAPVQTAVGRADLRILEVEPGQALGALGGEAYPGGQIVIGAVTDRPFAIGGGTIELSYDATLFAASPVLLLDDRYGTAQVDSIDDSEAGHLVVSFTSPADDLNLILHGAFFQLVLQALPSVPIGTVTTVTLGPATTLLDADGLTIPLETDSETIDFIDPEIVAAAGFEAGVGFTEWWTVVE